MVLYLMCVEVIKVKIKVLIEMGENGYFVAHCPSLKSCWTQGKTKEEALKNMYEAIELYLETDLTDYKTDSNHEIFEIVI